METMALNRLMHPRNIYKDKKPDFKGLAIKYPEFRQHAITDLQGKVHVDFKKPECLRALTWALLKEDWGLDVELPLDRLIPTIPLRLNYILWIEDLVKGQGNIHGIDIGAGASCVYALLGAKKNKWKFLVSEKDEYSHHFATKNVKKNELHDYINVLKVDDSSGLFDMVNSSGSDTEYTFCMCNPPFFANNLEAWGTLTSRSDDRPEPKGMTTAAPNENVIPGGEVEFVKKMIEDSMKLRQRVRVYSSMLGKKTSLVPLKDELRKHGITNFGVTEFCQGRTMRWGLGWTFDQSIKFPHPPSKVMKSGKPKPPIVYKIPHKMELQPDVQYMVPDIGSKVMSYLEELKVIYEPEKSTPTILEIEMVAVENTWSKQRRKRREQKRAQETLTPAKVPRLESDGNNATDEDRPELDNSTTSISTIDGDKDSDKGNICNKASAAKSSEEKTQAEKDRLNMSLEEVEDYILKLKLVVKKVDIDVVLELTWEDGDNIELMHQVMQFFKNRLK